VEALAIEFARIVGAQNAGWAAAVGLFLLLLYQERRYWNDRGMLQEKRIIEGKETVSTLSVGNQTSNRLAAGYEVNTKALENLKDYVTEIGRDIKANDDHWKQRALAWEAAYIKIEAIAADNKALLGRMEARNIKRDQ
jgi:hypothetical protein